MLFAVQSQGFPVEQTPGIELSVADGNIGGRPTDAALSLVWDFSVQFRRGHTRTVTKGKVLSLLLHGTLKGVDRNMVVAWLQVM